MKKLIMKWLGMESTPESGLKPGYCECGHLRCSHKNGREECHGQWAPDEKQDKWRGCSCQIFIIDEDEEDDEGPEETPTPQDLERLYQK